MKLEFKLKGTEKIKKVPNKVSKKPLVSVCVPTYKHEKYIKQCLDGILMQKTNFEFEILLGEDDSPDNTRQICIDYAKKFPDKIRLFLHDRSNVIYVNGNATGRYNFVYNLLYAKGKYIALCEGDDYWIDPLKLQKQVDFLETNKEYICCHHWQKYAYPDRDGIYIEQKAPIKNQGYFVEKTGTAVDIFKNKLRIKTRTAMYRNIINEDFFPDWFYKVAFGDVPLSFLMGKEGKFYFINEAMAVYRQTDTGVSKAGLKDLGRKQFIIQHFKNWIEIWDYADMHYNYRYQQEARETVSFFFKKILFNGYDIKSLIALFNYNLRIRKLPLKKKYFHLKYLLELILFNGLIKIKRKLRLN